MFLDYVVSIVSKQLTNRYQIKGMKMSIMRCQFVAVNT